MAMPKMSDDTKSHNFSEHHQRHVRTTFQYIDKLLSEAEHTMTDAGEGAPTPSDTFCANGKLLTQCLRAATEFAPLQGERIASRFVGDWKSCRIHARS